MPRHYSEKVGEALKLAADAFSSEIRKGTDSGGRRPIVYLSHLLQVATWVAENRGDEDQIIAAVLHDYLEDIEGATEAELTAKFGERVARLVAALSDTTVRPKPPWKERKVAYIEKLRGEPAEVKLISACDKLHNASRILADLKEEGDAVFDRFKASKEETLWYYDEVTKALGDGWKHKLVDRVAKTVAEIRALTSQSRVAKAKTGTLVAIFGQLDGMQEASLRFHEFVRVLGEAMKKTHRLGACRAIIKTGDLLRDDTLAKLDGAEHGAHAAQVETDTPVLEAMLDLWETGPKSGSVQIFDAGVPELDIRAAIKGEKWYVDREEVANEHRELVEVLGWKWTEVDGQAFSMEEQGEGFWAMLEAMEMAGPLV